MAETTEEMAPETADEAAEATAVPGDPILAGIAEQCPEAVFTQSHGQDVAHVAREHYLAFAEAALAAGFEMCVDVTAVDYLRRSPRFEVVAVLLSMRHNKRLRVLVGVPGDDPTAPSLVGVYPSANFYEREVFDLMGIGFAGHPDLTRILMPDEWEGHPLRKDSPVGSVPILFKSSEEVP